MVTIERLTESHVEGVLKVTLAQAQMKFTEMANAFLLNGHDTTHRHVILFDDEVVGFFKIDVAYSLTYEFCSESGIGLRAFAIDVNKQGKGIGTTSVKALFPYLKGNYSAYDSIYLTVNCKNPGARACYQNGGFEDTGDKYFGGNVGPQHIMLGKIE